MSDRPASLDRAELKLRALRDQVTNSFAIDSTSHY
jgi:hypothetical protein